MAVCKGAKYTCQMPGGYTKNNIDAIRNSNAKKYPSLHRRTSQCCCHSPECGGVATDQYQFVSNATLGLGRLLCYYYCRVGAGAGG